MIIDDHEFRQSVMLMRNKDEKLNRAGEYWSDEERNRLQICPHLFHLAAAGCQQAASADTALRERSKWLLVLPLQIALLPVCGFSQVVADIRQAHQQRYQERTGDDNNPPAVRQQCFFRQGQHTAPGDDLQRQAHTHKAEGGFRADGTTDIHNHHEHDGSDKVGGQVFPQNVEELAAHAL